MKHISTSHETPPVQKNGKSTLNNDRLKSTSIMNSSVENIAALVGRRRFYESNTISTAEPSRYSPNTNPKT